jgi:plasmid maintenance system antidote protein VapI
MFQTLKHIGWSPAELARRLGVRDDSVRHWLNGRRAIPENLATWLVQVRDAQAQAPALPDGWRAGGV